MRKLYTFWFWFWFAFIFFSFFPLFVLCIVVPSWQIYAFYLQRIWGKAIIKLAGLPVTVEGQQHLQAKQPYVLAPNHTSYMDIPAVAYAVPHWFVFMGKSDFSKIPAFGYFFSNLHIPVNRQNNRSKYDAFVKSSQAVKEGKSIVIFPQGGINSPNPPQLMPFKEGAFRVAIENQIPIVPITMPYNWKVMPDVKDGQIPPLVYHQLKIVIHKPIPTAGMTMNDLTNLRRQVYETIEATLKHHNPECFEPAQN